MESKIGDGLSLRELERHLRHLPFPPQVMSVHNAAMDLASITHSLKLQMPGARFYILGESYGAYLANYAYRLAPHLFDGALLDGFPPKMHFDGVEADIGHHLADTCRRSYECRQFIDPARVPLLVRGVIAANNPCTRAIDRLFADFEDYTGKAFATRQFAREILAVLDARQAQQTLIVLLHSAIECRNADAFSKAFARIQSIIDLEHPAGFSKKAQPASQILRHIVITSEKRLDSGTCRPLPSSFVSVCESNSPVRIDRMLLPFRYQPRLPPPYTAFPMKQIIVAPKTDPSTLHDEALTEFHRMPIANKTFYSLDYAPHVSMLEAGCAPLIMRHLFTSDEAIRLAAIRCVESENANPPAWRTLPADILALAPHLASASRSLIKLMAEESSSPPSTLLGPSCLLAVIVVLALLLN